MNAGTDPNESGNRDAGAITKWIAVVAAGLCALNIILNLIRPTTTGWVSPRIVGPLGVLLSMGSVVATHRGIKIVLAVCGVILAIAAYLLYVSGAYAPEPARDGQPAAQHLSALRPSRDRSSPFGPTQTGA
jgi:hypothetical protein